MKKSNILFIALVLGTVFSASCERNFGIFNPVGTSFSSWADSLTLGDVKQMYSSAPSFMVDVRTLGYQPDPFSYRDTVMGLDSSITGSAWMYPSTGSKGMTTVFYRDSVIFENTWNRAYMSSVNIITQVNYGELLGEIKIIQIQNKSFFPNQQNGYYEKENRLFLEEQGRFKEVDLKEMGMSYGFGEIKSAPYPNAIIFSSYDFARVQPNHSYFFVYDLKTGEYRKFVE